MTHFKGWSRVDWGTWALPLYVTYLKYVSLHASMVPGNNCGPDSVAERNGHIASVRVLCFGFFIEWSR